MRCDRNPMRKADLGVYYPGTPYHTYCRTPSLGSPIIFGKWHPCCQNLPHWITAFLENVTLARWRVGKNMHLWAVTLTLFVAALAGGADYSVWIEENIFNGCRFEPTFRWAVTMECDYDGLEYSTITFGPLSSSRTLSSIQEIRFSNVRGSIIFGNDALTGLRNLYAFHLSNIGGLRIGKIDWNKTLETENMTITMNDISLLHLDSNAFSGLQSPGPEISISGVTSFSIAASAFAADSVIKKVSFRNIRSLSIEDGAIQSQIDQVLITNTTLLDGCGNSSFSGRVGNFILDRVTIVPALRSGCVQADAGWGNLTVLSSQLGDIEPRGISGTFDHFQIRNSSVGRVSRGGLHLNVTSFTAHSTEVEELPCGCNPNQQALWQVAGDEMMNNATHDQQRGAQQVSAQVLCTIETGAPTLAQFVCWKCADRGGAAYLCQTIEAGDSGWEGWKLALVIGLPLLFGAVVALVIVRKLRQRNTSPPSNISPPLTLAQLPRRVVSEHRYTEAPKSISRQYQNAGDGVTPHQRDQVDSSGPGEQHDDFKSEPVYSEVGDPRYVPMNLPQGPAGQPVHGYCVPAGQPLYNNCGPAGEPCVTETDQPCQPEYKNI